MADPKIALAGIGKTHQKRTGPPPMIKAIKRDLIKVNFDPYKASAAFIRLAPPTKTTSASTMLKPPSSIVDFKALESEVVEDMATLASPDRKLSLTRPFSTTSGLTLSSKQKSTLAIAEKRMSSYALSSSRRSGLGLADSSLGLAAKKKKGEVDRTRYLPHGFRYRSNGDERILKPSPSDAGSSSCLQCTTEKAEQAAINFSQLAKLRTQILRQLPRTRSGPVSRFGGATDEKRRAEEQGTPGLIRRRRSEPVVLVPGRASRAHSVQEADSMFKQTILRHIRDMAQSGENHDGHSHFRLSQTPSGAMLDSGGSGRGSSHSGSADISRRASASRYFNGETKRGLGRPASVSTVESKVVGEKDFSAEQGKRGGLASPAGCLTAGNSSFNMRYGVPVKLMAQRKHILDEQHHKELEEVHKTNDQIAGFLGSLQDLKKTQGSSAHRGARGRHTGFMPAQIGAKTGA